SGAACPELGLWAGVKTRRGRPQTAAHVSAGEESAREATFGFQAQEDLCLLQVLAQGLLALSWGCGRESRHAGEGPKQLHTSLLGRRA
ncbi:hypothetical protein D9A57_11650, partial [Streptococcus agalactiae]